MISKKTTITILITPSLYSESDLNDLVEEVKNMLHCVPN